MQASEAELVGASTPGASAYLPGRRARDSAVPGVVDLELLEVVREFFVGTIEDFLSDEPWQPVQESVSGELSFCAPRLRPAELQQTCFPIRGPWIQL